MEVNRTVLRIIAKECCRSLSYNDEERQFSFPLCASLDDYWERRKSDLRQHQPGFTLDDFNETLDSFERLTDTYDTAGYECLRNSEIMNGEVISLSLSDWDADLILVRMKNGQYLDVATGRGIVLGSQFEFRAGKNVTTSEGELLGMCRRIRIVKPTLYSIILGRQYIGQYYTHDIAESLWPLFDSGCEYLRDRSRRTAEELLRMSEKMGVGSFSLLYILRGVCGAV